MATYIYTSQGIILVEGGAEAMAALREFSSSLYNDMANAYRNFDDGKSVVDYMQNSIQGLDPLLGGVQVVGSAAFSGAVEATMAPFGPNIAISSGLAAGKLYDWAFEEAKKIGGAAGIATWELLHHDDPLTPNPKVSLECGADFNAAQIFAPPRRDPLTFDLDGDGLETIGVSTTNPIYFDHDGDGNATATGWISPHDGFLAMDRNGDGIINNGTELFGDATDLYTGGKAADGFAALAQEDTNADGKVDASDARFANLRIWRDLNSNGTSEAGELFTLTSLGIQSINVAKTANSQLLPNGNVIADLGTYTKTDGSTATLGDTAQLGDVNLQQNTFISQFTDAIPLTAAAAALPNMNGSGMVRQLREVANDEVWKRAA